MRLWILRPIDEGVEPWYPWMEHRMFGFVVRAKDESTARVLAATHALGEGPRAWLAAQSSTCVKLTADGPAEVVMDNYAHQ
jgi:hypothetical protein